MRRERFILVIALLLGCCVQCYRPIIEDADKFNLKVSVSSISYLKFKASNRLNIKDGYIQKGFSWKKVGSYMRDAPNKKEDPYCIVEDDIFSAEITGLESRTEYSICSYVVLPSGHVLYSAPVFVKTLNSYKVLPQITDVSVISSSFDQITCSATVSSFFGLPINELGVCWDTSIYPQISDNKQCVEPLEGTFTVTISGLSSDQKYYIRLYAISDAGIGYSDEFNTTLYSWMYLPRMSDLASVSNVTLNSAEVSGNVIDDRYYPIINRGICYSTDNKEPSIRDMYVIAGGGLGEFTAKIDNLECGKMYYARAYAKNAAGVGYSRSVSFLTKDDRMSVYTSSIRQEGSGSITLSGKAESNGTKIQEVGFCWALTSNPSISDNRKVVGTQPGEFSTTLSGWTFGDLYYVRAYAINENTVKYGNQQIIRIR